MERTLDNTVTVDQWDYATNAPKRSARMITEEITSLTADVDRLFTDYRLRRETPPEGEIRAVLGMERRRDTAPVTLAQTMTEFARDTTLSGAWSDNTRRNYLHLQRLVARWNLGMTLDGFGRDEFAQFLDYCFRTGHINATAMKFAKQIRWTVRTAVERGLCEATTAMDYRPRYRAQSENDVVYLTLEELRRVQETDLSQSPHLDNARDLFLFCCFSGLRYSDASRLRREDVRADHIRVVTTKTADPLTIELNDTSRAILARHAGREGDLALPVISNQRLNDYIKDIARMAGVDAPVRRVWWVRNERHEETVPKWMALSSHSGRRTFVVTALSLGIPSEVVMRWTGHKNHATMRPYIAIVDDLRRQSMDKFNGI